MNLLPQFGFFELMLVAVIALIVVGPKDLPKLMRSAGRMAAKARAMASEFTSAFDQMAREAEMEELRAEIESLKSNNPIANVKRDIEEAVKPIDDELRKEKDAIDEAASASMDDPKPDEAPSADLPESAPAKS